ncbi:MAG: D-alanyl-D-alanine carboxypeptidase [Eubacterium sp.]|nr:D-alanyl-D-alanine carboxypeptidase [Eubacterium sp.]
MSDFDQDNHYQDEQTSRDAVSPDYAEERREYDPEDGGQSGQQYGGRDAGEGSSSREPRQPGLSEADDELFRKRQAKRRRKRTIAAAIRLIIAAVICIPLIFFCFWSATRLFFPTETEVTGLKQKIAKKADKGVTVTLTVTHPEDRDLELQRFDEETEKWVTEKTIGTGFDDVEEIKVEFPSSWKDYTYSKWRIHIDRAFGVKEYTGDPTEVTCRNRTDLKIKCSSSVIYCVDNGEVLYDQNMNKEIPNASTTKIMTAILAMENSKDREVVKFSYRAVMTPYAYYGIHIGYKFRLGDLMRAMLIQSANECATAIGEYVGGSYEKFRDMMNARAKELGCKHTHFLTPSGLDVNGHYSTAYDMALINAKAIEFDEYNEIMLMEKFTLHNLNKKEPWEYEVKPTNNLLKEHIKGYMGGKTGTTAMAGNCLSSAYKWKGKTYILEVFNTYDRFKATKKLMKYVREYA